MKVVFFGTPPFAAEALRLMLAASSSATGIDIEICAVITKPDKPQGRSGALVSPPVKAVALEHNIPVFQPAIVSDPTFAPVLEAFAPDLFVVVAYGEIIKQHLLDMPTKGCINLHASLLPAYRGAAPIQRCIIDGAKESGVSIMHMVKKMDAGDVIRTVSVEIGPNMTFGELQEQLCRQGCPALVEVVQAIAEKGAAMAGAPQDDEKATYAPKIELEECELLWERSAEQLHNLVRGTNPYPGAWCTVHMRGEKKQLKIWRTLPILEGLPSASPGTLLPAGSNMLVACGVGALQIGELQLEGRRRMPAAEFLRGLPPGDIHLA